MVTWKHRSLYLFYENYLKPASTLFTDFPFKQMLSIFHEKSSIVFFFCHATCCCVSDHVRGCAVLPVFGIHVNLSNRMSQCACVFSTQLRVIGLNEYKYVCLLCQAQYEANQFCYDDDRPFNVEINPWSQQPPLTNSNDAFKKLQSLYFVLQVCQYFCNYKINMVPNRDA